uniref:Amino acid permease/ SLC12A domain-containing protein n=1 Tax=Branchiostoma floridae TaxID=7739 RepID=C3Y4P2_BRAFL|eukprot:XP_002608689.1 hypothetical protein BRAFLDRAFT_73911 [Branchiostoma floridae]
MADEKTTEKTKLVTKESSWPVLLHFMGTAGSTFVIWRGVNSIEPAMKVMIPGLFVLIITAFIWALTQHNAGSALAYIFTPDWQLLGTPRLWIDALSQNAWDTGAACGIFLVYGASMTQSMGPVKTGTLIPLLNNTVSLMSGTMVFCTVFSTWTKVSPGGDKDDLMKLLKTNGPANTGLTFVWMPILFSTMTGGRVMASLYFLMVVVAGFSSYVPIMYSITQVLVDWGEYFGTQAGDGSDWKLPKAWEWLLKYVLPVEGLTLLVWWVVSTVRNEKIPWYQLGEGSLMTAILGWFVVGLVLLGLNLVFVRYRARMSRWWSSLIAKQEDIPACCCGHRQDRGDRDNPMTMTDKAKEAPVLEYNTID